MTPITGFAGNRSKTGLVAALIIAIGSVLLFLFTLPAQQQSQDDPNSGTRNSTISTTISAQLVPQLKGRITLSGAFALYPLAIVWGEEFQTLHPDVKVDVSAGGAGKSMTDILGGLADIGMISRAIDPSEISKGAYPISVTKDAVVAAVNTKNPVLNDILSKGITRETFTEIWVNGTIKTWGQVVGKPEITYPIHVYTRSDSSGAADIWAKYLGANLKQENLKGVGVYSDPGILAAVQNDPLGISFTNFNFIFDNKTGSAIQGVKVVSFDVNENGKVDPEEDISTKAKTVQAIEKGVFPHPPARAEYFVTKGSPTGITKEFIKWVLTDGQKFVAANGYVELPKDVIDAELKKVG